MLSFFKNILVFALLFGIIFAATNYSGTLTERIGVKGVSTDKAKEISNQISTDVNGQMHVLERQVLDVRISDFVNGLSRAKKIPDDVNKTQSYVREKINNVLKSRK